MDSHREAPIRQPTQRARTSPKSQGKGQPSLWAPSIFPTYSHKKPPSPSRTQKPLQHLFRPTNHSKELTWTIPSSPFTKARTRTGRSLPCRDPRCPGASHTAGHAAGPGGRSRPSGREAHGPVSQRRSGTLPPRPAREAPFLGRLRPYLFPSFAASSLMGRRSAAKPSS